MSVILGHPIIYLHYLFFSSLLIGFGPLQLDFSHIQAQSWWEFTPDRALQRQHGWDRLPRYGSLCRTWSSIVIPAGSECEAASDVLCHGLKYITCLTEELNASDALFLPFFPCCQGTEKALPRQEEFLSWLSPIKSLTFSKGRIMTFALRRLLEIALFPSLPLSFRCLLFNRIFFNISKINMWSLGFLLVRI